MASSATEIERPLPTIKPSRAESARWVPLAFAAVYILWGSTYIGIRIAIESFPPLAMAAIRHSMVGLILYPILRVKMGIKPTAAHWWTAAVTGVSLLCVSNGGLSWAEQRVRSGIAALLVATISLWLVILDWLRPRGTRPGPLVFVGLVLGFAGMALLVGPAKLGGAGRIDLVGTGVLVVASFVWACASLYSKQRDMPASPLLVVAMQSLAGAAALWVAAIVSGEGSRAAFRGDFGTLVDGADLPDCVWVGDGVHGLPVYS
jgi:drug/metabolite transporter (DMT)-like permease